MDFDTIWQVEDEITTMVDASIGCGIWQLDYDAENRVIRLELEEHLDEEKSDMLCAQFTVSGYYNGEGCHGSMFVFQIES
jgi:hypothetical protein